MVSRIVKFMEGNTIAMIALFIALGGTATAATTLAANSVGSKQIKKNAVTAAKIKNGAVTNAKLGAGAVTGAKIAAGTITGDKIAAGTITGDKINVATLPKVPSAASADNAATLGGVSNAAWGKSMVYMGTDWQPRASGQATWDNAGLGSSGLRLLTGGGYFFKTLDLPQGATITKITMYYTNAVAGDSGSLWISRVGLAGNTAEDLNHVNSGSAAGTASVSMTPNVAIDNTAYCYVLFWGAGTVNNIFLGATVDYTLPGATAGKIIHAGPQQSQAGGPSTAR